MAELSRKNSTLLESVPHGTSYRPIEEMSFHVDRQKDASSIFSVDNHWHPEIEFVYIVEGRFYGEINLNECILNPGDIMIAGSQDLHALKGLSDQSKHEALIFHPKAFSFSYDDEMQRTLISPILARSVSFPNFIKCDSSYYSIIVTPLLEIIDIAKKQTQNWYIECKLRLMQLLNIMKQQQILIPVEELVSSNEKQKIERYKILTSYMEENLSKNITLSELSNLTSTNPQYLCRFFKEISGISPIQYLINRRIDMACAMLLETDKSILTISMDCGFDNVSYFIRKFKQKNGVTPREYRKRTCSCKKHS